MLKKLLSICSLLFFGHLQGQNLVPNGGFEDMKNCPETFKFSSIEAASDWENVPYVDQRGNEFQHTPDFYHQCARGPYGTKNNKYGDSEPASGKGYGGFIALNNDRFGRPEYLITPLKQNLIAGYKYKVSLKVRLAQRSKYDMDRLSVLVLEGNNFKRYDPEALILNREGNRTSDGEFFSEFVDWISLNACFTAKGGEDHLIIGNFMKIDEYRRKANPRKYERDKFPYIYFYVDDVELIACRGNCDCSAYMEVYSPNVVEQAVEKLKNNFRAKVELRDIRFNVNEYEILPESFPELNDLAEFLIENKNYTITVHGHTDNTGDEARNMELSEQRAEAVKSYLISKSVNAERINTKWHGANRPKASNQSGKGRELNRRVEIDILK